MTKQQFTQVVALTGIICAAHSQAADATSVEDRLNQLEKTVQSLQEENQALKTQMGWDGKSAITYVKPGGKESKLNLSGFIHAQGEFGDTPDARFNGIEDRIFIRRARVAVSGSFAEHFDFKLETDLSGNSISEKSGISPQLTDGFINWSQYSFANVKVGQFKLPFGYEQLASDTKIPTIERSLSNDRLTDGRQIGLGVAGDFLEKRVGYSVGLFNGTGVNTSANDNESFLYAGRVYGVPFAGKIGKQAARWAVGLDGLITKDSGVSKSGFGFDSTPATAAKDNLFRGDRNAIGVDTQFSWGRFGFEAEYLRAHFEPNNNIPDSSFDSQGWYAFGTFDILPKKLQAVFKYESFDPDTSTDGDTSETYTLGLTYFIKGDDLKVMVNYLLGNPAGEEDHQGRLLTRFQLMF